MHLFNEIGVHALAIVSQMHDPVCKVFNVDHVQFTDFCAHTSAGRIQNVVSSCLITFENIGEVL